jgi:CheY-like chemotaxis protein
VLRAAVETSQPNINNRHHQLDVQFPQGEVWLDGDSVRLAQVIGNLLNNAAKFTPPGGRITLSASCADSHAVIRVQDNGIGIAPEHVSSIFNLFSQAGHAPDRVQDGLGIGLSLVRTLVHLHGGSVSAQSGGTGMGSTFEVTLPATKTSAPACEPAETEPPSAPDPYRILVVDDSVDAAEIVGQLLEHAGHVVHIAHDGASAIAAALQVQPHLVFLDIGLPDMSGGEVAARMRELPALQNIALVALTGYGQHKDRESAMAAGFNHHLTKPVSLETLSETVQRFVKRQ